MITFANSWEPGLADKMPSLLLSKLLANIQMFRSLFVVVDVVVVLNASDNIYTDNISTMKHYSERKELTLF